MKILICDKIARIIKSKKKLEEKLNLKIIIEGRKIILKGESEAEYLAEKVIQALDFGFPFSEAMSIKEESKMLEAVKIKEHTKRKDLKTIRARIIGKKGKTLKVLRELTNCAFEIKNNEIGVIGYPEEIQNGKTAVINLIHGAKHANVYSYLEKHHTKPIEDFGLKNDITQE